MALDTKYNFHFRKTPAGGYTFDVKGHVYMVIRNEAGFAGRDWELFKANEGRWTMIADQFASRTEAASHAFWYNRPVGAFYDAIARAGF